MENKHTLQELQQWQALSLDIKILMTRARIRAWVNEYGENGVYVSFSGGKDSTVLLDLVRNVCGYKNVPAVFVDTGLEYPEIREFVKTFDNVEILRPKMNFKQVIEKYGYPFISKEVSEKAMYARKYLTKLLESEKSLQTDRQTDRQTDIPYAFAIADFLGIERRNNANRKILLEIKKGIIPNELIDEWFSVNSAAPMKAKCLFGTVPHKENGVLTGETSKLNDYSKYKFLIRAPFNVSNECCDVMKKSPIKKYAKETGRHPMTAQMASESRLRTQKWIQNGCNGFNLKEPISNPMAFWTEQDVLLYIKTQNLPICSVYGDIVEDRNGTDAVEGQLTISDIEGWESLGLFDAERLPLKTTGCSRTGCMFCGYGCHLEKPGEGRFERMKETHPKQYEYIMKSWENGGLNYKEVIDWINEHGNLNIRY